MKNLIYLIIFLHCSLIVNAQWTLKSTGDSSGVTQCFIESFGVVLAGGNDGSIYSSTNYGDTWTVSNTGIVPGTEILSLGKNSAGIFAGADKIYFSNNNGASWSIVNNSGYTVFGFAFLTDTVFAASWQGGVVMSPNNGTTWIPVNTGLNNDTVYSILAKGNLLFAGTFRHGVFVSSNSGANWSPVNTGLPLPATIRCLETDGTNIYSGTTGDGSILAKGMFISANNGTSWTQVTTGLSTSSYVFSVKSIGTALLTASGNVFRSLNNGSAWSNFTNGIDTTCAYGSAGFLETSSYVFCGIEGGCDGTVYRIDKNQVVGVNELTTNDIDVSIYPNPFSNLITLTLNKVIKSKVEIQNMLGEKVFQSNISERNSVFRLDNLPSGIYFLTILAEKNITTRKIIKR